MDLTVVEEPITLAAQLTQISIAFTVDRVYGVLALEGGVGGLTMVERTLDTPYIKDYDSLDGGGPARWSERFNIERWGLFGAYMGGEWIGAAAIVPAGTDSRLLGGWQDSAVLWDLRVAPQARGRGVGSALFRAAEGWARARGYSRLQAETQNVNVAACKFYARQGCVLGAINCLAYPTLPDEAQLVWFKDLSRADRSG